MPVQMEDSDAICLPLSPVIEMPSEYPEEDTNLLPCSICNRTFNPKSLERHEKVCQKVQTTKRNTFDPSKQRAGENAEALGSITKDRKNSHPPTKKKSRWREKHAEFLKTIRAARTTSDDSDEGSPQRLIPSDYIKCQHCDRYFGPKAADRHISWCEEQKNRLPSSRTNQDTQAIQRLKTRTKYTPPKPGQNGWRAPKKKDVISSIPPPNVGANIPPPGRLISPPPCSNRQFSPPPISYPHRTLSPSPSRRETLASLPPGGPSRYSSTSSLGRSSGKQFSTMLQSMTGCPTGYGLSTGYGSSYMYGSPNQNSHFNRSASLRLPRKRPSGAKRMARHRDLASDMLSSVSVEGGKRQEPEGGEDRLDSRRHYEQSSYNKSEKEEINEKRKDKHLNLEPNTRKTRQYDLAYVKNEREALDKEIMELANQLKLSSNGDLLSSHDSNEDEAFNELGGYSLAESDEEFDIPTEESFLKSSTSASGDDDNLELTTSRPRSVHFEDEYLTDRDSQFVSDYESVCSRQTSNAWSAGSSKMDLSRSSSDYSIERRKNSYDSSKNKVLPIKTASKESVREILKKRREESVYTVDHDSRRRVKPITNDEVRSRSRSRDNNRRVDRKGMRNSSSLENFSKVQQSKLPFSASKERNSSRSNAYENSNESAIISRKEYNHFKSLIGSRSILKEPEIKRPILKQSKQTETSKRTGDAPYDPYCAAELQLQDLLGPAKSGVGGMRSDMLMGSTGSLKGLGLTKHALQHRDYSPHKRGLGSMSLCSFRLDTLDHMTDDFKSPGDESSELESLGGYSNGIQSPIDEFEDLLASLTTVNNDDEPKSEYDRRPESRNGSRSRTVSSQSNKSPYIDNDSLGRIRPDGSYSWKKSPSPSYDHSPLRRSPSKESSPPYSYNSFRRSPSKERSPPYIYSPLRRSPSKERTTSPYSYTPLRRSLSKEKSPIYQNSHAPTTDFEKNNRGHAPSVTDSNNYGWKNRDSFSSPQNFSRHLRKISPLDDFQTNKTSSLNLTRSKNILENKNYLLSRLNEDEQRVSSGSSTDSSLPLITSPMSSGSNLMEPMKRMSSTNNNSSPSANLPKFCYECGNKYPVSVAKFCCQCGAPRVT